MDSDPMTKEQGDKIIDLLEKILDSLEDIARDASSLETTVGSDLKTGNDTLNDIYLKLQER
jgi:DNA-binding ferritin-like protein (Dps family)